MKSSSWRKIICRLLAGIVATLLMTVTLSIIMYTIPLILSSPSETSEFTFVFWFVSIGIFISPVTAGCTILSFFIDRFLDRFESKEKYNKGLVIYSILGIIVSFGYSIILFDGLPILAAGIAYLIMGLVLANIFYHILLFFNKYIK
ncbi:hypothetical protein [Halalkalibacterium ligniniphilum]|uniref:hypothetical protein n=1 Tax=Halalkalibacterium ligniniphilum TaxID=1134413 RepID=UPI001267612E|nr:hypothetical protein [Halalkalibacterium ligniniphilum]